MSENRTERTNENMNRNDDLKRSLNDVGSLFQAVEQVQQNTNTGTNTTGTGTSGDSSEKK